MNIFTFTGLLLDKSASVVVTGCDALETSMSAINDCALLAKGTTEAMRNEQAEENKQRLQALIGELKAVNN